MLAVGWEQINKFFCNTISWGWGVRDLRYNYNVIATAKQQGANSHRKSTAFRQNKRVWTTMLWFLKS